ncbi:MAG: SLC13 family permease [Bryobacter sp.]|nr:SLC13 family permease [Bryobacter sp.]
MQIAIVLILCAACVYALATEKLPVDLTAIFVSIALILTRILTPEQGLSGFGHPATVTVAAMFVLSAGLAKTGALNATTDLLTRIAKKFSWLATLIIMLVSGVASAFINNTAVVAILMPNLLGMAKATGLSPSRLLMPLSFASMFGGVCTLIGTSTNILISSIAEKNGLAPFGMFELSRIGLLFFGTGFVYMFVIGMRLIPDRRPSANVNDAYGVANYVTDVVLSAEAKSVGTIAASSPLAKDLDVQILAVFRQGKRIEMPPEQIVLLAGDVVRLACDAEKLEKLHGRTHVSLISDLGGASSQQEVELVEAVIAPRSPLIGHTLKSLRFYEQFQAKVLALRHRGQTAQDKLDDTALYAGDTLLLRVRNDQIAALAENPAFVLISPRRGPQLRPGKTLIALLILGLVVLTSALNLLPIVVAALAGCAAMVLTGCLKGEEVYSSVDWKVVFMLGGLLPLGLALETTGAAKLFADFLFWAFSGLGPWVLMSALFLFTSLLTEVMSNSATAVLLAPVAISAAAAMGVDARPFLVAVTLAASSSFMTPVGYQTNTLIYGPGQYSFSDFLRVGTPLNLLFWLLATYAIPLFWPFYK